ncbi:MAG: M50 family metallopeptidase [Acidobacteriota bacterium]
MRPRTAILLAAAAVYIVAYYVPFGDLALYPLTLFTTWVHEMGHGLTALALGGRFDSLEIFKNAGGVAHSWAGGGWPHALVALGGLLAPPIVGACILATVHGPRRARMALAALAAALVASMIIWVRSATGLVAMPMVAVALAYAAVREPPERRVIIAQVLAVVLAIDTLTRMVGYVFEDTVDIAGKKVPSDIATVADGFGGPQLVWGCAVTAVAVGLLAVALWWAWRRPVSARASSSSAPRAAPRAPSRIPSR